MSDSLDSQPNKHHMRPNAFLTVGLVVGPIAAGCMIAAPRFWNFEFVSGWPEGNGWWIATLGMSALAVAGFISTIIGAMRGRSGVFPSVTALAVSSIVLAVFAVSWGNAAQKHDEAKLRAKHIASCVKDLKRMTLVQMLESKYSGAILKSRPTFSNASAGIYDKGYAGGYYKPQIKAATRIWRRITNEPVELKEICFDKLSNSGDASRKGFIFYYWSEIHNDQW